MANEEHLTILRQGVAAWNSWRESSSERPDLYRADLSGMDLRSINLCDANLNYADLKGAILSRANLKEAILAAADLRGADLSYTYMFRAYLTGAWLNEVNLSWGQLMRTDVSLANFEKAIAPEVDFTNANLSQAIFKGATLTRARFNFGAFHMSDLTGADLSEASMHGADFYRTNLSGANLQGANLCSASFVETKVGDADLTRSWIYGASVWEIEGQPKAQLNLNIARPEEPPVLVDDIEVAQFIYLLLKHRKLRKVINAVTEKGVLLLGRFGNGGLAVLQAIADRLREEKYLPIIFDFDRPEARDYTETVLTLAGLSRFVITDLSGASTPQELYATVPHLEIPFVSIVNTSGENKAHSMWVDFRKYHWFIGPPLEFQSAEEITQLLPTKVIARAESKYEEIKAAGKGDSRV